VWLAFAPSAEVREVLRLADADPYRSAVRDAIVAMDADRVVDLAGRAEALAQPVGFAAALGQNPVVAEDRRRSILALAIRSRPNDLTLLQTMGISYPAGQPDGVGERLRWYQAAVAAHPRNAIAHSNLGVAVRNKGDLDGAVAQFHEALRRDPTNVKTYAHLSVALRAKGDLDGAIASLQEALTHDALYAYAHNGLGWLLAVGPDRVRDGKKAVEHATRACEVTAWKNPSYLNTLAAAYAESGDFDQALEYQNKALAFPAYEGRFGAEARQRLELYAQKKPYRDPTLAPREPAPPRAVKKP
jgi:tetratricopeptide (TPR) repeat protein